MDSDLSFLRRQLSLSPSDTLLREKLTSVSLRSQVGWLAAWRSDLGPFKSHSVEITQPLFLERNPLSIKQTFSVTSLVDTVTDLVGLLPLKPNGIINLETKEYTPLFDFTLADHKPQETFHEKYFVYQPLYDTATISSCDQKIIDFFQIPLGARRDGFLQTQTETNIDRGGSLCHPKHFRITGISLVPDVLADYDDVLTLLSNSWFRIFIGVFDYQVIPSQMVSIIPCKVAPTASFGPLGLFQPVYPLPQFADLVPQQNFRAEVVVNRPLEIKKPFKIKCILHGFFFRYVP